MPTAIRRAELERLEGILTNCVRGGPESENRENAPDFRAHLQGRIAYVHMIDPVKSARLRAIFDRIRFSS